MATVDKGGTVTLQELLVTSSPFLHRALCLKTTFIRHPHPCPSAARPTPWERSSPISHTLGKILAHFGLGSSGWAQAEAAEPC